MIRSIRRRRLLGLAGTALLCGGLLAACGDDDTDDDGLGSTVSMAREWSVLGALEQVPASAAGDTVYLQTADLDAATVAAGLERPAEGTRDAIAAWLNPLTSGVGDTRPVVFVPMAESFNFAYSADADEFAAILGWSVLDVTSYVEQAVPPYQFAVVDGVEGKLSTDLIEVGDGIVTDIDAEDLAQDFGKISAVTRLGRPTRLAERDGLVAMSTTTPSVRAWLADPETLADDESLASVARALDDEDVVSAVVATLEPGGNLAVRALGSGATPESIEQLAEEIDAMVPADPYDAVGIGWSVDDGQAEIHVAYHFLAESGAERGAVVLGKTWRDGVSVSQRIPFSEQVSVDEVDVEGPVVTVTLHPTDKGLPHVPLQMLQQREPVFLPR